MEGQECMKVLKRVNEDLTLLSGKVTQQKVELMTLEKEVQKQNEKMLKLVEWIDSVLEHVEELEEEKVKQDRRIQDLEAEVKDLKPKVCQCTRAEDEISAPEEVRVQ